MGWIISKIIRFYQKLISPLFPPSCRFYPSCSEYARLAFLKYSFFKAFYLSLKRLIKCQPFHPGGYDPLK
ncbi:MAG: membrane protein insertion efficiency factor YidD [Spirochaetota bacterium]|nr:membrane protein insertion efficiency factor YidD [Spirochaetota bacterium]